MNMNDQQMNQLILWLKNNFHSALQNGGNEIKAMRATELEIISHTLMKTDHIKIFEKLSRLRDQYSSINKLDEFEEFWNLLLALIHPFTLTYHGFHRSLSGRRKELLSALAHATSSLNDIGYEAFVNSGTLLGLTRESGFISYDDDLDIGVFLRSSTPEEIAIEWYELKRKLKEKGWLDLNFDTDNKLYHYRIKSMGTYIDLFPSWVDESDRLWIFPYLAGLLDKSALLPLKSQYIDNFTIQLPQDPQKILEANYGPSWGKPDPLWKFDWGAALMAFHNYLQLFKKYRS